jgi:hypothetical protein
MDGRHRHSVVRTSRDVYPSAVKHIITLYTACTPEVRVHIGSQAFENTAIRRWFSKCREMFLNLQPLPVLQFLLKKQMTAKSPGPFLAEWLDSTYSPGDIRVRHHPLKHFDIAFTSLFNQGDSFSTIRSLSHKLETLIGHTLCSWP